jgi:protein TonB
MLPGLVLALFLSNAQASSAPTTATQSQPSAPCENPDKDGRYHLGCGVKAPEVIYKVEPDFTEEARKKKVTATCTIGLTVDIDGRPTNIHIVHSAVEELNKKMQKAGLGLDQKAMEAVAQYKFTPATFKGQPVPLDINVEISFQIY